MSAVISPIEISPLELKLMEGRLRLDPQGAVTEILRRLTSSNSDQNKIEPVIYEIPERSYLKTPEGISVTVSERRRIYASIPGLAITGGPGPDSWAQQITASGSKIEDVYRQLGSTLLAPLLKDTHQPAHEVLASLRVMSNPEKPEEAHFYKLVSKRMTIALDTAA